MRKLLTAHFHFHWVLLHVGSPHQHAGEHPLVVQRCLGDEQAEVGRDAHPGFVAVCGLDGGLLLVCLLHQEVAMGTVVFRLIQRERKTQIRTAAKGS